MSERRAYIMRPMPAKREEDVADAIEAWEREEMELKRMDPQGEELPEAWRMTALKCQLAGQIKDHIDINAGMITGYDQLRSHVMKYAVQRRLERTKTNAGRSAMGVGGVGSTQEGTDHWQWGDQPWGGQEGAGETESWGEGSGEGGVRSKPNRRIA